jgi:hypothetical protein
VLAAETGRRGDRLLKIENRSLRGSVPPWPAEGARSVISAGRSNKMFGSEKIKLDKALLARVKKYAEIAGYSSVEEFITHALEKEIKQLDEADSEEEIKKRLKGLGYIS